MQDVLQPQHDDYFLLRWLRGMSLTTHLNANKEIGVSDNSDKYWRFLFFFFFLRAHVCVCTMQSRASRMNVRDTESFFLSYLRVPRRRNLAWQLNCFETRETDIAETRWFIIGIISHPERKLKLHDKRSHDPFIVITCNTANTQRFAEINCPFSENFVQLRRPIIRIYPT